MWTLSNRHRQPLLEVRGASRLLTLCPHEGEVVTSAEIDAAMENASDDPLTLHDAEVSAFGGTGLRSFAWLRVSVAESRFGSRWRHAMNIDTVVERIAQETARELEEFCSTGSLQYANERDHLAKCCKLATERVTASLTPPPALSPFAFGDKHGWLGLGLVDVVLRWTVAPTFIELKSGNGKNTLRPCVWDAVKLAIAVLKGNAANGYLLAASPAANWKLAGAELFDSRDEWKTLGPDIRDAFLPDWRKWELEGHIPGKVAVAFKTVALGTQHLTIAGTPWELRLARVESIGDQTVDWATVLESGADL